MRYACRCAKWAGRRAPQRTGISNGGRLAIVIGSLQRPCVLAQPYTPLKFRRRMRG